MDREWSQAQISFEITMRMRRRIVRYLATKLVSVKITDMDEYIVPLRGEIYQEAEMIEMKSSR
jgi:hypothetical protein